jgi:hypothetical protein
MSIDYDDEWCDGKGNCFDDVLFGAALTNRPFMKDLNPINLMELEGFEVPDGKFPKEDSGYKQAWDSAYRCANCAFYREGTCLIVDGEIDEDHTSNFFQAIRNDSMSLDEEKAMNDFMRKLFIDDQIVQDRLLEIVEQVK